LSTTNTTVSTDVSTDLVLKGIAGLPAPLFAEAAEDMKTILKSVDTCKQNTEILQNEAVTHHFEDGVYGRELAIPADTLIVSRVHKTGSINIISKGKVIIYDCNGRHEKVAPCTFTSPKGTHRMVYAVEDSVWTSVHHTTDTDPDSLFDDLTTETYQEFLEYIE